MSSLLKEVGNRAFFFWSHPHGWRFPLNRLVAGVGFASLYSMVAAIHPEAFYFEPIGLRANLNGLSMWFSTMRPTCGTSIHAGSTMP
jgi:hypothetical protein